MKALVKALEIALAAHSGQVRKGTEIPYIQHPLAVSSLVIQYGGDAVQAAAAMLHDTVEDGGPPYRDRIEAALGRSVLELVLACTDGMPDETGVKPPWEERKRAYLKQLMQVDARALLVICCDKLHNVMSIVDDLRNGENVWERFKATKEQTLWYYDSVLRVLGKRLNGKAVAALEKEIREMKMLAIG